MRHLLFAVTLLLSSMLISCRTQPPTMPQQSFDGWGPAVEGFRCYMYSVKPVWRHGEVPTFAVCVHSEAEGEWGVPSLEYHHQIEIDGVVYQYAGFGDMDEIFAILSKGDTSSKILLSLDKYCVKKSDKSPISLAPGKHTARAFISVHADRMNIKIPSNQVEFVVR